VARPDPHWLQAGRANRITWAGNAAENYGTHGFPPGTRTAADQARGGWAVAVTLCPLAQRIWGVEDAFHAVYLPLIQHNVGLR
jgi:hypothetical protein